jgi:predicted nucleotidyltransferase
MVDAAEITQLARQIATSFPTVEKIILFGSYAYGRPTEDSDIDLLVIMEHPGRGREMRSRIHRAIGYRFPTDIIVRQSDDVERRYREHDPLVREALDKGTSLHERNHSRTGLSSVAVDSASCCCCL